MRIAVLIAGIVAALLVQTPFHETADAAERLRPPFDVAARRALLGTSSNGFVCKPVPAPVSDLTFGGIYRSGTGSSEVDPDAMRAYRDARRPIDRFANTVIGMGDRYVASRPADTGIARCVLEWLYLWAEGRGFLGEASQQGGFVRKWALGTIALAWLKVRDADGLDTGKASAVKRWIGDWANIVRREYSTDMHKASRNNNHAYWAAWSVGTAAVALDDGALFAWMVERYRAALRRIDANGTLPLELARRSKALHYHVFSVQALVMIAELGAANGQDLYGEEGGALHRLVRRTVDGLADPAYFESLTGRKQTWVGQLNGSKLAWMEPYYARFRISALDPWLRRFRPMKNRRVGGDATLLYGARP